MIVKRNRRGQVVCAQFRYGREPSPIRKSAHRGQRYSVIRTLGDARLWQHRRLVQAQDLERALGLAIDEEDADLFVRAVFRAVPLSILRRESLSESARAFPGDAACATPSVALASLKRSARTDSRV